MHSIHHHRPALLLGLFVAAGICGDRVQGGLEAYVNPLDGSVPVPRAVRVDGDESRKLAFPSARGHGQFADPDIGPGQPFQVIKVTNTQDNGPGSFRDAWMATGPRVIVFTVSGTIVLTNDILAREAQDDVYIAGQTSPGGIQLACGGNNAKAPLRAVRTSDMVARYLKLRPGLEHAISSDVDSLAMGDVQNCIFDHLSLQWSTDEAAHITSIGAGVTLQWCLQSEPLRCGSCRSDGHPNHDYGVFADRNESITFYRNLFMGGHWRNPNAQATHSLELINNVGYNFGEYAMQFYVNAVRGDLIANVVANWYAKGPKTIGDPHLLYASWEGPSTNGFEFYLKGNVCHHDTSGNGNADGSGPYLTSPILHQDGSLLTPSGQPGIIFLMPRGGGLSLSTEDIVSAEDALRLVLNGAGAIQDVFSTPRRDLVDQRSIDQVRQGGDRTYLPQPETLYAIPAPGYPDLAQGATWSWVTNDTDDDGMLDSWELMFTNNLSLTPESDPDGDGWSTMEEFLNYLAGEHLAWTESPSTSAVPPVNCGYPAALQPETDSDHDGLPDDWERYYLNTLSGSATNDLDEDGMTHLSEWIAGTDPDDSGSVFSVHLGSGEGYRIDTSMTHAWEYWYGGLSRWYSLQDRTPTSESWVGRSGLLPIASDQGSLPYVPTGAVRHIRASVHLR